MSNYECSLQGIIIGQEQKDRLIQRLVGICGNDSLVDLFEHEIIFTPSTQTPVGPARNDDVVLRVLVYASYSFEVVRKGHLLAYDKTLKITVSQLYKLKTKVDVSSAVHFGREDMWVIEATSLPVPQEQVNQMAEHLGKFKNSLIGFVELEYVDNRALQNRIPYST
ncbi:hypothetical protein INT48_002493 [Thamnidium elegans]|uniref:Mediator of RNA polymerase II transcription subunit 18 n=1 Tax=Thamnidium elegans TaxID=101142 RepID=A0A8H7SZA0_9FUNG|nr:hypothetical protein INT48_002493 [Thamnidium elegans]